ncbi:hypothetical protein, partial [Verminephrobacter aporrectodeae]|uniref:hypothetical protein n=1 Tax=Verminephrobacter aporrectodeae TaxID=1110389 RepID=UPI0022439BBE
ARAAQARQGQLDAAILRVARALVHGAAADVVAVFGQVRQMAESNYSAPGPTAQPINQSKVEPERPERLG